MISLLDRLINEKPIEQHASIKRDLENLLNTRVSLLSWHNEWKELNRSLISYGIPDFTPDFCKRLSDLILHCDPRFKTVTVTLLNHIKTSERVLCLHVEGLLYADPTPEPIIFDSIIANR